MDNTKDYFRFIQIAKRVSTAIAKRLKPSEIELKIGNVFTASELRKVAGSVQATYIRQRG